VETILVHTALLPRGERAAWLRLAEGGERVDLRLVERDGRDLLFAVR
jgi:hypothetical protein